MPNDSAEFFTAVSAGDAAKVKSMLAASPDLANAPIDGGTPLHYAAIGNHIAVIDLLIAAGADLDATDNKYGMTAAGWANEEGHTAMVRYLVKRGARAELPWSAGYGLIDQVRQQLAADPPSINREVGGWTPLLLAALWGQSDVVELLFNGGADPDMKDADGRTALAIAKDQVITDGGHTPLVRELRRQEIVAGCRRIVAILQGADTGR